MKCRKVKCEAKSSGKPVSLILLWSHCTGIFAWFAVFFHLASRVLDYSENTTSQRQLMYHVLNEFQVNKFKIARFYFL